MRSILNLLLAAMFGLGTAAQAANTSVRLLLSAESVRPGDGLVAAVHLRMNPQWHTYWKNSGASGIPTSIQWELPPGITAGEIQWPVPEKLPPDDLTTYIYEHEAALLVPLKVAPVVPPGSYRLKAAVAWLECKEQCLPGQAAIEATLTVSEQTRLSPDAPQLQSWQDQLPKPAAHLNLRAGWETPDSQKSRFFFLEWTSDADPATADFYPLAGDNFEVQGATERVPAEPGRIRLRKEVRILEGDWPKTLSGLLVQTAGAKSAFDITVPLAEGLSASAPTQAPSAKPLWEMLFYAFLGGLILNFMPCVLPVIALKILGFVGEARNHPGRVRRLGLIYTLGVVVSFVALAALVIGVQAAGKSAGWGMQFGNPQFLVLLTVLITLVALNLFGLFEVNAGGRVMGAAGELSSQHGAAGAFFNGVLATVLATPCTAPFLGIALGFAFAQPAPVILLIFVTAALGLAFPYVLLSWQPAWLKFLPKPGAWMEKFKIAMGFPMLATAVWILSLVPLHYGKRSWWLGVFLVVVALAAWIYGEFIQRGKSRRGLAGGILVSLLIGGYAYALEQQLDWRRPARESNSGVSLREGPDGIDWQRWSPEAVTAARAQGRPVLVDFTADWCLTCQANKKIAIEIPSVRAKLKEIGAVPFLGDYTALPADMTAELKRHGRAGVPLVLVFPRAPEAPPILLPELLTPGMVLDALDKAGK